MSDDLCKLNIDGTTVEVPRAYTLLQACEASGAEIPRFCYHERLSVAGNCRMCLVEWKGAPKLVASCAQTVGDMRPNRDGSPPDIRTRGDYVEKARRGVMEFLLINHPLDCPVCDQGGECDLQDQAMAHGTATSRYTLNKRAIEDKNMGPLVKTIMTRCIQCTRCVRFAAEIAGVEEIGMISRGESVEITTYLERSLTSELSGNVIDLCPVGALTAAPCAYNTRPWELRKVESIDIMDAMGSAISIGTKGDAIMRILPVVNEEVNEEWLSDKARFVWDGLARQRLDRPYVRTDGRLVPASWNDALIATQKMLSAPPEKTGFLAGDLIEVEQARAALDLARALGINNTDCRPAGASYGTSGMREHYILNPALAGVDEADALFLIGVNPRIEAAVWNARIRQAWLWNNLQVFAIGARHDLTYAHTHLGDSPKAVAEIARYRNQFKKPAIVIGEGALTGTDAQALFAAAHDAALKIGAIRDDWAGFGVLHNAAGRVGALDCGFIPGPDGLDTASMLSGNLETLVLLGVDEIDLSATEAKVVYVGSHGDAGAARADIVLPATAWTEMAATYVNTEGRVQMTRCAVQPKGQAQEGWAIFRALSGLLGKTLPYDSADDLRCKLREDNPVFAGLGHAPSQAGAKTLKEPVRAGEPLGEGCLVSPVNDFYLSNPIARASRVMAECSAQKQQFVMPSTAE